MIVSEIIQMVREETGLTVANASDNEMLRRLNIEYKKIWSAIVDLDKNYGRNRWVTDLVAGSNEYTFLRATSGYESSAGISTAYTLVYAQIAQYTNTEQVFVAFNVANALNATINVNGLGAKKIYINPTTQVTANYFSGNQLFGVLQYDDTLDGGAGAYLIVDRSIAKFGQYKIEKVGIKYPPDNSAPPANVDYINVELRDWDNFQLDMTAYEGLNNGSYGFGYGRDPFAVTSDNSLFIYPTPSANMAGGLKLEGAVYPYDLTISMVEGDILVPDEYHDVIMFALIPRAWRRRQLYDRLQFATQEFKDKRREMLIDLANRKTTPTYGFTPSSKYSNSYNGRGNGWNY